MHLVLQATIKMKRTLLSIIILLSAIGSISSKNPVLAPSYAWKLIEPLGLRQPSTIDTVMFNYAQESVPSAVSDAWACTGNLGAEGINMIYIDRPSMSDFFFKDALSHWYPTIGKMTYYNTRIPMTLLSYTTAGTRDNSQERLSGVFSGNINKRAQIGGLIDFLYSKGSYNYQADKDLSWGLNGSYMGDRYEFQGFVNNYNLLNKENGGITDDLYITDPAELQGGESSIEPKNIPTRLSDAHTRVAGKQIYLNNRYKVGFWREDFIDDTTTVRTYVPVTSFIWTLDYQSSRHVFRNENAQEARDFFEHTYINDRLTDDRTSYSTLTNTIGVSLLEGFNKYAKAGLAVYATHQLRSYKQTIDTLDRSPEDIYTVFTPLPEGVADMKRSTKENLFWAGAQLTKQQGRILNYAVDARLGVLGPVAGDIRVNGRIDTRMRLFKDTVSVSGIASFSNEEAPFLMNNYLSNHFAWKNNFGKVRRLRLGGEITIPQSHTRLEVAVENIQNSIYFGPDCLPVQASGSVQVVSARLHQDFRLGILHWNNRLTYQTTTDDKVIPLPKLAIYSNLYIYFKVARVLQVQLGIDCDFYTRYYGVGYQPATASFYNQRETKVGGFPFMNLYANMKLSRTRFFIMMSHVNQGMGKNDYFSLPHYPLNPRRFQMGLSIDFAN